ncbi:hypothetical protein KD5_03430 [Yersinia pseudotuberculosis]|uniref:DUF7716 domain-containing protein n=1 Tax=Yersinia pseudotuberculosis TaxID=633 RepID=UPI00061BE512|nr:hypothetical protein [Yersinia pseudotuberculosis]CNL66507.1 Uncharacterised protein [Yersinia pseudotuberculosis]
MKLITISEVLSNCDKNPQTWFYLPPETDKWNLNTKGIFSLDSSDYPPDSTDYLPRQAKENGWIETLDGATIEDIVENAKDQLNSFS